MGVAGARMPRRATLGAYLRADWNDLIASRGELFPSTELPLRPSPSDTAPFAAVRSPVFPSWTWCCALIIARASGKRAPTPAIEGALFPFTPIESHQPQS
ncbi:unnamed protein product [Colletotrichum noveboracense]|uniref:Uncharacterized protein n=1 Tax=Colletotrichum noveboracense TaxID=2664923 RepID=A0A9W4S2V8_9PEZI|nr:unnamed protein product [Colletotrichum noveboracense]